MAVTFFNNAKEAILNGDIDLTNDTIKVMLTSGYTMDADNDNYYSDVSASEVSGTGYTAGGQALSNKSVTQDNTNDLAKFDADDVTWSNSTITADGAIIYKDTGTGSTSPVIAYYPFTSASSSNSDFTLQWNSNGIFTLS